MKRLKCAIDEAFSAGMEFMSNRALNNAWSKLKRIEIMKKCIRRQAADGGKVMNLWVVEMWSNAYFTIPPRWEPTVGVALTRRHGMIEIKQWRKNNPHGSFRLVKYRAARELGK
ncbi:MAG: hypothetical protein WC551_10705 [Patescibacteria group bacterium]|jgi:hypothetical protein